MSRARTEWRRGIRSPGARPARPSRGVSAALLPGLPARARGSTHRSGRAACGCRAEPPGGCTESVRAAGRVTRGSARRQATDQSRIAGEAEPQGGCQSWKEARWRDKSVQSLMWPRVHGRACCTNAQPPMHARRRARSTPRPGTPLLCVRPNWAGPVTWDSRHLSYAPRAWGGPLSSFSWLGLGGRRGGVLRGNPQSFATAQCSSCWGMPCHDPSYPVTAPCHAPIL